MIDFTITTFQEELVEAIHWHTVAIVSGENTEVTLRRLEEAYTHFRYYTPMTEDYTQPPKETK